MLEFILFIILGGVMWIMAHQLAPLGYGVSFVRILGTVVLVELCTELSKVFLSPIIGDWYMLVNFACCVLVAVVFLRLKFMRSILIVSTYFALWIITAMFLGFLVQKGVIK